MYNLVDDYHDLMTAMGYSFMAWMISFMLLHDRLILERFSSQRQVEVLNRVVSIFHGQICFWGAVVVICKILIKQSSQLRSKRGTHTINSY